MEKVDHIGIAVKDLDATLKFYEEVLGLQVTQRMDHGISRGAFMEIGGWSLSSWKIKTRTAPSLGISRKGEKGFNILPLRSSTSRKRWKK